MSSSAEAKTGWGKVDKGRKSLGRHWLYYAQSMQTGVKEEVCEAFELGKYEALKGFHCDWCQRY